MNFTSKFIDSGAYGCVIKPGYSCKNNIPLTKTVSKLFSDKKEWTYEIKQNEKIYKIDKLNNFTVRMLTNCEIDNSYIRKNVKNMNECSIIDYNDKIYEIVYEDGGYDLRKLFMYNELFQRFPNFNIKDFLLKLKNIFDGIYNIELLGLTHRDIKLDNILFNGDKISLIDFGLMEEKSKIFNYNNLEMYTRADTYHYPIELKLYAIKKLKLSFNNVRLNSLSFINIYEEYLSNKELSTSNKAYINELKKIMEKVKKDTLLFFEKIKQSKQEIDLKKFEKIDVYLLGIILFEILMYIAIYIPTTLIKSELFNLVSRMIEINPYNRISMNEARNLYRQIINN